MYEILGTGQILDRPFDPQNSHTHKTHPFT